MNDVKEILDRINKINKIMEDSLYNVSLKESLEETNKLMEYYNLNNVDKPKELDPKKSININDFNSEKAEIALKLTCDLCSNDQLEMKDFFQTAKGIYEFLDGTHPLHLTKSKI